MNTKRNTIFLAADRPTHLGLFREKIEVSNGGNSRHWPEFLCTQKHIWLPSFSSQNWCSNPPRCRLSLHPTPFSLSPLLPSVKMGKAKPFGCPDGQPCPFCRLGASQGRENGSEVQGQGKTIQTPCTGFLGAKTAHTHPLAKPLRSLRQCWRFLIGQISTLFPVRCPAGQRTRRRRKRCSPSRCLSRAAKSRRDHP